MDKSSATVNTRDGSTLRMEVEIIEVPYISRPAEHWHYTDERGHEHYWAGGDDPYPTLRPIFYRSEDGDALVEHLECNICGEHIRPGVTGPGIERIPGRASYYLDDKPITPDEYARLLSENQDGGVA